jgi:hypothetical protein
MVREALPAAMDLRQPSAIHRCRVAGLTRDGKLFEDGKDARFGWRLVIEIDRRQGNVRLDTRTRYVEE